MSETKAEQEIVLALTEAGYAEHRVSPISNADRFFQRRVRQANGVTLYFLNVGFYDRWRHGQRFDDRYALQLDVDFYHPQWTESSIELTFAVPASEEGIAAAETLVATLYAAGRFEPDRHNNDDLTAARAALARARGEEAGRG